MLFAADKNQIYNVDEAEEQGQGKVISSIEEVPVSSQEVVDQVEDSEILDENQDFTVDETGDQSLDQMLSAIEEVPVSSPEVVDPAGDFEIKRKKSGGELNCV